MIYFPTAMARYSLFVLKVSLNTKQTNERRRRLPAYVKDTSPATQSSTTVVADHPAC